MTKVIRLTEQDLANMVKKVMRRVSGEKPSPCPEGKKEDELITFDDAKKGKVIKKGYCNSNPSSAIVKVQELLKKLGYLDWDGLLGYYGDSTSKAIKKFYSSQSCSRTVDGSSIGPSTIKLLLDPNRYNQNFSNEEIIASTLLGEASTQGREGQIAVYSILKNRAKKKGDGSLKQMAGEALRPLQFSYWNDKGFGSNPRCTKGKLGTTPEELQPYLNLVRSNPSSNIGGATHYVNKKLATVKNKWWENKKKFKHVARIGEHDFYVEI
jgi:peptidoglycan hydrolase-like protein with peptidoglycan-binding domain